MGALPSPAEPGREAVWEAIWEHLGTFFLYAPPKSGKSLIKPGVFFKIKPKVGYGPFLYEPFSCTYKKSFIYKQIYTDVYIYIHMYVYIHVPYMKHFSDRSKNK